MAIKKPPVMDLRKQVQKREPLKPTADATPNSERIIAAVEIEKNRKTLTNAIINFNKHLSSTVLAQNMSEEDKKNAQNAIDEMLQSAINLDAAGNEREGSFALFAIIIKVLHNMNERLKAVEVNQLYLKKKLEK